MKRTEMLRQKAALVKNWVIQLKLRYKVALVLGIIILGVLLVTSRKGAQMQTPQYQTAQAEAGTLITSVSASGTVSASGSVSITTQATGIVKQVYVTDGESVAAGQKIADITLDLSSQQKQTAAWANYLSAQNNVNAQKSKMNSLQSALFKANQTFTNGAGTSDPNTSDPQYIIEHADWLQAEANYTQQAAVIQQAEVALSSSWFAYAQTSGTITAPSAGIISNLTITPGTAVTNSSSTSSNSNSTNATTMGAITMPGAKPQATINLSEIDVTKVAVGQKATLTLDAFPDKTFTGKVTALNTTGSVSSGVTTYPATITFDTDVEKMYANMVVTATIITQIKDAAVLVPSAAVQTTSGQSTVRILRNDQVTTANVEVGDTNDTQTEIISGVTAGETIIVSSTTAATSNQSQGTSPFSTLGGRGSSSRGAQQFIMRAP